MIIATKVETRSCGMRTAYYKYKGSHGKPTLGSKSDAASFPPEQAKKVLSHLQTIDARFAQGELIDA